jgi:hypothetical protein
MKGTRLVGAGLLTLAMMLVALPASGAFAAKLLVLSSGGTPIANGSTADTGLQLGECGISSNGKIMENGVSKVKLIETSTSAAECPAGESISGKINETELKGSGSASLKGTITVTKSAGPCVYNFTKFKAKFEVPGFAIMEGETTGKLDKVLSNPTKGVCEKKLARAWFGTAAGAVLGEPFEDALKA